MKKENLIVLDSLQKSWLDKYIRVLKENREELNSRDLDFFENMEAMFEAFGVGMTPTVKQWNYLSSLAGRYL